MKDKLHNYILNYQGDLNYEEMYTDYITKNKPNNSPEEYVIKKILNDEIEKIKSRNRLISIRENKLENLKKLELPEQRSEAWYQMRKTKLTASSLASAIGHCHFQESVLVTFRRIHPIPPSPQTKVAITNATHPQPNPLEMFLALFFLILTKLRSQKLSTCILSNWFLVNIRSQPSPPQMKVTSTDLRERRYSPGDTS